MDKESKELENLALQKVLEVSSAIDAARQVDEVICALHSLGTLIFSVDSSLISGAIDERFKDHILSVKQLTLKGIPSRTIFTMARPSLQWLGCYYLVAPNWLAQFAKSVRSQIYDSFFLEGPLIEVLEALVPILNQKGNDKDPVLDKICSSAERLLVLCYLEKEGIRRMVIEFDHVKIQKGVTVKKEDKDFVSRVAQLLASIPDKTRTGASSKLSSLDVSHHPEAHVRRSVLFAASCILVALHPSYVASALIEGNQDISTCLEWIRTYSLQVAEADSDTECASMAMHCLRLHSEMALETSRALESADRVKAQSRTLPSKLDNIIIPFANMN